MKSYEEAIQFTVSELGSVGSPGHRIRYQTWVAYIMLAAIYGKSEDEVAVDIAAEIKKCDEAALAARKQASRDANETRRLANLAAKNQ